jgi:hypothetical protein
VAAAALVVLAGAVPVRLIEASFDPFQPYPGHTADYGVVRPRAIRAALPEIADREERQVLVLGSSAVARAFVPSVFDATLASRGKPYVSYNLAQMLYQPETALAMATVIRDTYQARSKRVAVTIFGISVPELDRDSLRAARSSMPDQSFAFSNTSVLIERGHTEPFAALGDALDLAVFGNVRPERVGLWLEDRIAARPLGCNSGMKQPPDGEEAQAALVDFCAELLHQFPRGVPPWNPTTRGALDFGLPETRPMLARLIALQSAIPPPPPLAAPAPSSPPRTVHENIDEGGVRQLVAAIRELKTVSDEVLVLRDILNPAILEQLPPGQEASWRTVAERIAREGDAPMLDGNDGAVGPGDFGDRTHLNPLAAERFSQLLATRVRPFVEEHRASR